MPVRAPTKRLVLIAQAVDVTPEELEEAGRPDAARHLREMTAKQQLADQLEWLLYQPWPPTQRYQIAMRLINTAREAEEEQQRVAGA